MKNINQISTFSDFWPRYLSAHADPGSRALHFAGVLGSVLVLAALLRSGLVFFVVLAVVPAQVGARLGHKLSLRKGRKQAPELDEHPGWSALADLKMFWLTLAGRLGRELTRVDRRGAIAVHPVAIAS